MSWRRAPTCAGPAGSVRNLVRLGAACSPGCTIRVHSEVCSCGRLIGPLWRLRATAYPRHVSPFITLLSPGIWAEVHNVGSVQVEKSSVVFSVDVARILRDEPQRRTLYFSPAFALCGCRWRLFYALGDCNEESCSLYLESLDAAVGCPMEARCSFQLALTEEPLDHSLRHTFCSEEPNWGVQDLLSLEDVAGRRDSGRPLVASLRLTACKAVPYNDVRPGPCLHPVLGRDGPHLSPAPGAPPCSR